MQDIIQYNNFFILHVLENGLVLLFYFIIMSKMWDWDSTSWGPLSQAIHSLRIILLTSRYLTVCSLSSCSTSGGPVILSQLCVTAALSLSFLVLSFHSLVPVVKKVLMLRLCLFHRLRNETVCLCCCGSSLRKICVFVASVFPLCLHHILAMCRKQSNAASNWNLAGHWCCPLSVLFSVPHWGGFISQSVRAVALQKMHRLHPTDLLFA